MSDYLQETAQNFENASNNSYEIAVGNRKKQVTFLIPTVNCEEFTHITGLDHLSDISELKAVNIKQKLAIFKNILTNQITYNDISKSQFINSPIANSYNFKTQSEYTINDRILSLNNFKYIMDNIYKGKVYKWNLSNCNIKKPNGKYRNCSIEADYLITIPGRFDKETIYLFAYQTNKEHKKSEPIILNIFSAFPDGVDLTRGQDSAYTILEEKKNGESIFIHPSYKKDKDKEAEQQSAQSQPQSDNIIKVKFDNPIQKNITVNSSGAIAVDQPAPSFFSSIFERLKQTFSNLFKPQDKFEEEPPKSEPREEPKIIEPEPTELTSVELKPIEENSIDDPSFSPKMNELIKAREKFAAGNISVNDYVQALKNYLSTLHGEQMWKEAAEMMKRQLDECPENQKSILEKDIRVVNSNIRQKFPPAVQKFHSIDEIREHAHKIMAEAHSNNEERSEEKNQNKSDCYR